MALITTSKIWTFSATTQGWVANTGANTTSQWQTGDTSVADGTGCLEMNTTGKNRDELNFWKFTGTWASIFGISSTATVLNVNTGQSSFDWKCSTFGNGSPSNVGTLDLLDGQGNLQIAGVASGTTFSATGGWSTQAGFGSRIVVPGPIAPATSAIQFRLNNEMITTGVGSPSIILRNDQITVSITYAIPDRLAFRYNASTANFNPIFLPGGTAGGRLAKLFLP